MLYPFFKFKSLKISISQHLKYDTLGTNEIFNALQVAAIDLNQLFFN